MPLRQTGLCLPVPAASSAGVSVSSQNLCANLRCYYPRFTDRPSKVSRHQTPSEVQDNSVPKCLSGSMQFADNMLEIKF